MRDEMEADNDFEKLEDVLTTLKYSTQQLSWHYKNIISLVTDRIDIYEVAASIIKEKRSEFIFPVTLLLSDYANSSKIYSSWYWSTLLTSCTAADCKKYQYLQTLRYDIMTADIL
jgi:hypothetical protein